MDVVDPLLRNESGTATVGLLPASNAGTSTTESTTNTAFARNLATHQSAPAAQVSTGTTGMATSRTAVAGAATAANSATSPVNPFGVTLDVQPNAPALVLPPWALARTAVNLDTQAFTADTTFVVDLIAAPGSGLPNASDQLPAFETSPQDEPVEEVVVSSESAASAQMFSWLHAVQQSWVTANDSSRPNQSSESLSTDDLDAAISPLPSTFPTWLLSGVVSGPQAEMTGPATEAIVNAAGSRAAVDVDHPSALPVETQPELVDPNPGAGADVAPAPLTMAEDQLVEDSTRLTVSTKRGARRERDTTSMDRTGDEEQTAATSTAAALAGAAAVATATTTPVDESASGMTNPDATDEGRGDGDNTVAGAQRAHGVRNAEARAAGDRPERIALDPRAAGIGQRTPSETELTDGSPVLAAGTLSPEDGPSFGDRLSRFVMQAQDRGEQLSVRVTPPDMGTILIRVRNAADGLQVRFDASSEETQQLLNEHLPRLQEALIQLGRPAERIDVVVLDRQPESGQAQQGGFDQQARSREQPPPAPPRRDIDNPAEVRQQPRTDRAAIPGIPERMQELNVRI